MNHPFQWYVYNRAMRYLSDKVLRVGSYSELEKVSGIMNRIFTRDTAVKTDFLGTK